MSELCYLGATEALELFAKREISPVELLEAVVARTEAVNDPVNAVTERMYDQARAAALESERRWSGHGAAPRALEGLPVALKEEQPIAGHTLEEGSLLTQGEVAAASHPVVERVLGAGAVVHLRTTTPEFSCTAFTHSRLWGVTRNPWNLEASPGGSSGGSGAALAAGMTTLATGSDIGGSIRIPASFCGVVGFKPPFARVPGLAPFNQDTYCADGPMGRSVADVALLQNVLAGPWVGDQASLRPAYVLGQDPAPVEGLRVAVCETLGDFPVAASIRTNLRAAGEALRGAGALVEQVELPWSRQAVLDAAMAHFGGIFGAVVGAAVEQHGELLMPYTRAFAEQTARFADAPSRLAGMTAEAEIYRPLGELLERFDVLLAPTVGSEMYVAGDDYTHTRADVDGEPYDWQHVMLTIPFNVVGRVPVLAVPSGIGRTGVPTGVQIVGRTYEDQTVFTVGAALERELRWWADAAWRPSAVPSAT